jgi:hypothetical protein
MEPGNLPLITMFDETQCDSCFPVFELGLCGVLSCNSFTGLRRYEDLCLSLDWLALLQATEAAFALAKQLIYLNSVDCLVKFGTGPIQQRLVEPRRDNSWDRCVGVGFALLVQRVALNSDEPNAESTENDQSEENRSQDDQEFFHALGKTSMKPSDWEQSRASSKASC